MDQFLGIEVEEISGHPPIMLFTYQTNIQAVQTTIEAHKQDSNPATLKKLIQILEQQSQTDNCPQLKIEPDGRIACCQPRCPECQSEYVKRNGTQKRILNGFFNTDLKLILQKYQCKICQHTFKVDLNQIIDKYAHYTRDLRTHAIGYAGERALSLGESAELLHEVSGVALSRETIRLWKNAKGKWIQTKLETEKVNWSGIYSYDEQFVTIKGQQWYRCLLFDVGLNRPVNDLVVPERNDRQIRGFLIASLKNKPVHAIVTDGCRHYTKLIVDLFPEASHQICIFHAMERVRGDLHEAVGHNRYSKAPLPKLLKKLYGRLWNVFLESKSIEDAEKRFLKLYNERFKYPLKVRHRLELLAENFVYLTEYLVNSAVPRTNNPAEGYFQRTYPSRIKKKFRTADGLQTQIMCIDGCKGGMIDSDSLPSVHDTLQRIYQTFSQLVVAADL